MRWSLATMVCAALLCAGVARANTACANTAYATIDDFYVNWKGQRISTAALPANFPSGSLPALKVWGAWASEHGYRLDVDGSGRALLVTPGSSSPGRWLKMIDGALKLLDEHLPPPSSSAPVTPSTTDASGHVGGGIPEDPEAPPAGAKKSLDEALNGKSETWGVGSRPLDSDTIVLFAIRDEKEYKTLLAKLVELAPYLGPWSKTATNFPGFALEEPLAGAFVLGTSGQEEWDPENELLHRAAELSLMRRFGRQPYWLLQGWAWHVEQAVKRGIYCFPYRNGFVGVGEHGGWDKVLRQDWSAGGELGMKDLAALRRGVWDDRAARHAWGTIAYLDRYRRDALPSILADLRTAWDKGSRRDLGAGRWERIVDYEPTLDEQLKILRARAGDSFLADVQGFFTLGSSFKPH